MTSLEPSSRIARQAAPIPSACLGSLVVCLELLDSPLPHYDFRGIHGPKNACRFRLGKPLPTLERATTIETRIVGGIPSVLRAECGRPRILRTLANRAFRICFAGRELKNSTRAHDVEIMLSIEQQGLPKYVV